MFVAEAEVWRPRTTLHCSATPTAAMISNWWRWWCDRARCIFWDEAMKLNPRCACRLATCRWYCDIHHPRRHRYNSVVQHAPLTLSAHELIAWNFSQNLPQFRSQLKSAPLFLLACLRELRNQLCYPYQLQRWWTRVCSEGFLTYGDSDSLLLWISLKLRQWTNFHILELVMAGLTSLAETHIFHVCFKAHRQICFVRFWWMLFKSLNRQQNAWQSNYFSSRFLPELNDFQSTFVFVKNSGWVWLSSSQVPRWREL